MLSHKSKAAHDSLSSTCVALLLADVRTEGGRVAKSDAYADSPPLCELSEVAIARRLYTS